MVQNVIVEAICREQVSLVVDRVDRPVVPQFLRTQDENAVTTYAYTYEAPESVDIAVYNPGYMPFFIRGYSLGSSNASLPCAQVADVSYFA